MQPLHFKKKYMEMLHAFRIEIVNKRHVLKTSILDNEGEHISVSLGEVSPHSDLPYFADAPFDFVAAFLYQQAKQYHVEIKGLDEAIESLVARWKSPTLVLQHMKDFSFIRFNKEEEEQQIDVLYEEFAAILTRSFNSISVLLEQLKGNPVSFPSDEDIEFIQYVSFSHLSVDTDMFLNHYKIQLDNTAEEFEMCEEHEFMRYVHYRYPQVIVEREETKHKEKIKVFREQLENEYNVTSQLLKHYHQN